MCNQYNKLTTEQFIQEAQKIFPEYIYDNSIYESSRKPLIIECKIHGEFEQSSELLLSNKKFSVRLDSQVSGCNDCKRIEFIQQLLKDINLKHNFSYTYPELNIMKNDEFTAICKKHGGFKTSIKKLQQGTQCKSCSLENQSINQFYNTEIFIEKSNKIHSNLYDYKKVKYLDSYSHISIICKTHGEFFQSPYHHLQGQGCKKCSKSGISKPEQEIYDFIKEIDNSIEIETNTRKIISPKELDIYLPSKKFAIEYNGLMWHSFGKNSNDIFNNHDKEKSNSKNHLLKTQQCEDQDIQLFHIFENEWLSPTKRKIWESVIKDKLGMNKKIGARKCEIKLVTSEDARLFLDENHLQSSTSASIRLGLYFENSLVSLMTFGKSRMSKKYEYELIRFCSKKGYSIQGGASKLMKYFEINYNPKSIVSYANRRWSTGNLYETIGFDFSHISGINYFYFNNNILYSRNKFQKYKLKNLLEKFDENDTETENMYNNNYRKIYDSGNLVYYKEY